jgi:hypothetical protein
MDIFQGEYVFQGCNGLIFVTRPSLKLKRVHFGSAGSSKGIFLPFGWLVGRQDTRQHQKETPAKGAGVSLCLCCVCGLMFGQQDFTFANVVGRGDDALIFHLFNQTGSLVIADAQFALDVRG